MFMLPFSSGPANVKINEQKWNCGGWHCRAPRPRPSLRQQLSATWSRQPHPGHLGPLVRSTVASHGRGSTTFASCQLARLQSRHLQEATPRPLLPQVKVCYTLQLGGTVPDGGSDTGLLFSMSNLAAPMWSRLGPTRHSRSPVAGFFIVSVSFFTFAVVNVVELHAFGLCF